MTWVKLDRQIIVNKKVRRASPMARLLYMESICWSNLNETDGRITDKDADVLSAMFGYDVRAFVPELVKLNLYEEAHDETDYLPDGGWWIHDYEIYQPTRERVRVERELNAKRAALHRNASLIAAIKVRDQDHCRYCGLAVTWADKRSPSGATYSHIDPTGPNALNNVVVACRFCVGLKGQRTPGKARMTLLPPPDGSTPGPSNGVAGVQHPTQIRSKSDSNRPTLPGHSDVSPVLPARRNGSKIDLDPVELAELRSARRVM